MPSYASISIGEARRKMRSGALAAAWRGVLHSEADRCGSEAVDHGFFYNVCNPLGIISHQLLDTLDEYNSSRRYEASRKV